MKTKIAVYFMEATPELMEPEALKKVIAAGGVLYKVMENGCWVVTSHQPQNDGFARISRKGKRYRMAQVAWEQCRGPAPAGERIYQQCGNRGCICLDHLVLKTPAEIQWQGKKGRMPKDMEITTTPLTGRDKELIHRLFLYGASRRTITLTFCITRTAFDQLRQEGFGLAPE